MSNSDSNSALSTIQETALQRFSEFAHLPGSVLLESSLCAYNRGKQTFLAHSPTNRWEIGPSEKIPTDWATKLNQFTADRSKFHLLFLSYEFGTEILAGESLAIPEGNQPKLLALSYNSAQCFDSVSPELDSLEEFSENTHKARITSAPDKARYLADVTKIKDHIREGDIYQANYTGSWEIESKSAPWEVYKRLRALNPSQYGAFANLGKQTIISSSPERLFSLTGKTISANPIKGTIPTGQTPEQTQENRRRLLESAKDKAELLMIVDLLRNDLGKICRPGTVKTESIWRPEEYSSLIHLVADITGELAGGVTLSETLSAIFPGGSITGAPKKRAVEILRKIENRPRGIYTGSIGYIYGDTVDFNIAIRTMTHREETYTVQAGGGIVADSDPEAEFDEARLKARNLIRAIDPELKF